MHIFMCNIAFAYSFVDVYMSMYTYSVVGANISIWMCVKIGSVYVIIYLDFCTVVSKMQLNKFGSSGDFYRW